MRNAGDRTPGGSSSRRPRAADAEPPPPGGGASLFTPAYRVNHGTADSGTAARDATGQITRGTSATGSGRAAGLPVSGHSWDPGTGQAGTGYEQASYGEGTGGQAWPDDDFGSSYDWAVYEDADAWPGAGSPGGGPMAQRVASNAVRGFPPAPGDSLPVYPPGPFAAWNRRPAGRQDGGRDGQQGAGRTGGYPSGSQLSTATITPDEFDTDYSLPAIKDPVLGQAVRAGSAADRDRRSAGAVRDHAPAARAGGRARGRGRPPGRAGKKHQPTWLAVGTAGVVIAAVAAILVLTKPGAGSPTKPKPTSTPQAKTSPTPPAGPWGYIGSRKTDPVPLTIRELYPRTFSNAGTSYTRAARAKGTNCRAALIGPALQAAVHGGDCIQTVRATYVSESAKVMATIGVFNLNSFTAASKAASKAGHAEFVSQLTSSSGPANAIGQGTGIEEALVKGHYLVLVWAEATNLSPPKTAAGRARLEAFMNLLVKNTVNVSLSTRMVDGKPIQRT